MPNHIANRLTIVAENKERLDEVLSAIKTDEQEFDFNTLIPMPQDLMIDAFYHSKEELAYAKTHKNFMKKYCKEHFGERFTRELFLNARQQALNIEKYGYPTWYGWACANWGTKWNAYDINIEHFYEKEALITFNTAWSAPIAIYEALAKKFEDIRLKVVWADEDMGCNCGEGVAWDGVFGYDYAENLSDEAYELYFQCNEWARDEYVKVNGKWTYIDDIEDEENEEVNS